MRYFIGRLKEDEERFDLKAGDLLIFEPYQYDPQKFTVVCRLPDYYDPECNCYYNQFVKVADIQITPKFEKEIRETMVLRAVHDEDGNTRCPEVKK